MSILRRALGQKRDVIIHSNTKEKVEDFFETVTQPYENIIKNVPMYQRNLPTSFFQEPNCKNKLKSRKQNLNVFTYSYTASKDDISNIGNPEMLIPAQSYSHTAPKDDIHISNSEMLIPAQPNEMVIKHSPNDAFLLVVKQTNPNQTEELKKQPTMYEKTLFPYLEQSKAIANQVYFVKPQNKTENTVLIFSKDQNIESQQKNLTSLDEVPAVDVSLTNKLGIPTEITYVTNEHVSQNKSECSSDIEIIEYVDCTLPVGKLNTSVEINDLSKTITNFNNEANWLADNNSEMKLLQNESNIDEMHALISNKDAKPPQISLVPFDNRELITDRSLQQNKTDVSKPIDTKFNTQIKNRKLPTYTNPYELEYSSMYADKTKVVQNEVPSKDNLKDKLIDQHCKNKNAKFSNMSTLSGGKVVFENIAKATTGKKCFITKFTKANCLTDSIHKTEVPTDQLDKICSSGNQNAKNYVPNRQLNKIPEIKSHVFEVISVCTEEMSSENEETSNLEDEEIIIVDEDTEYNHLKYKIEKKIYTEQSIRNLEERKNFDPAIYILLHSQLQYLKRIENLKLNKL